MRAAAVAHVVQRADAQARHGLGLGDVRGDDAGARHELGAHRAHRIAIEQRVAALGHHHRVDDEVGQLECGDGRRHRLDDCRRREHAGLRRVDRDVGGDGLDLRGHELGWQRVRCRHDACVLGGDGGDRADAVAAVRRKRLEIGLDAGAAAGVAAGDGQVRFAMGARQSCSVTAFADARSRCRFAEHQQELERRNVLARLQPQTRRVRGSRDVVGIDALARVRSGPPPPGR